MALDYAVGTRLQNGDNIWRKERDHWVNERTGEQRSPWNTPEGHFLPRLEPVEDGGSDLDIAPEPIPAPVHPVDSYTGDQVRDYLVECGKLDAETLATGAAEVGRAFDRLRSRRQGGFTVMEMLIVLAILGVLGAIVWNWGTESKMKRSGCYLHGVVPVGTGKSATTVPLYVCPGYKGVVRPEDWEGPRTAELPTETPALPERN